MDPGNKPRDDSDLRLAMHNSLRILDCRGDDVEGAQHLVLP